MKKLFAAMALTLLLALALPLAAGAQERATSGACGANLTWRFDAATATLTISGTGPMKDYGWQGLDYETSEHAPWLGYNDETVFPYEWVESLPIRRVVVQPGVTSLGNFALYGCENLTELSLPDTLTSIGRRAISECTGLTSVSLPDSVTELGENVFFGCQALQKVKLSEKLTEIPRGAFRGAALKTLTFPAGITKLGAYAFVGCDFARIDLPESLEIVEEGLLYASELEEISLPESVKVIGRSAFEGCKKLGRAVLPEKLERVESRAFYGCTLMDIPSFPANVSEVQEEAFSKTGVTQVTIPGTLKTVGVKAFGNCTQLEKVHLGPGVTALEKNCFYGCTALKKISFPRSLETLGEACFCYSGLEQLVVPGWITVVPKHCFSGCPKLQTVLVQPGVKEIREGAFGSNAALTYISLPETLTELGAGALNGCTALTALSVPGTVETFPSCVKGCTALKEIVFLPGVRFLEWDSLGDCPALRQVYLPRSLSSFSMNGVFDYPDKTPSPEIVFYYQGTEAEFMKCLQMGEEPVFPFAAIYVEVRLQPTAFQDVFVEDYFARPVEWGVQYGIVQGVTATSFGPGKPCTRAQIVTFLWRCAGEPEPRSENNPFTDVQPSDYFYKAVLWAAEEKITGGTTATTFSPKRPCTRAQAVTFLWRLDGGTPPKALNTAFTDVKIPSYYHQAVNWAVEQGVTYGTGAASFSPDKPCTRGQIVSFLYRYFTAIPPLEAEE